MKKILMYRWKAYNYLDIKKHFELMGYEVDEVYQHLESYDVAPDFYERIAGLIRSESYDFVFSVNYFSVISTVCHDLGVLYVSWACDSPLISMYHESVFYDTNRIFLFDYTAYNEFAQMGVGHVYYLPLCTDPGRMKDIIEKADDLSFYTNDISFVGSLYERNYYDTIDSELTDYLRGYLDSYIQIQSNIFGTPLIDVALTEDILAMIEEEFSLDKSEGSFSNLGLIFSATTLGFKTAQISRIDGLNMLAKTHKVSIYTNSDTEVLPRVNFKGSLDYWGELPKVFAGSDINLNFTIPNIKSGIPLRVWDVMGSGGFLLSSWQSEMELFFKEGESMATFKSLGELSEKADFYMKNAGSREKIAKSALKLIEKYHTYDIRMNEMMKSVS